MTRINVLLGLGETTVAALGLFERLLGIDALLHEIHELAQMHELVANHLVDEVIGYEFVHLGKFMDFVKKGIDPKEALEKAKGCYGRFAEAKKYIDPRHE